MVDTRSPAINLHLCFLKVAGRELSTLLKLAAPRPGFKSHLCRPPSRARGSYHTRQLLLSVSVLPAASVAASQESCDAASSEGTWGQRLHTGRVRPSEAYRAARRRLGLYFPSDRNLEFWKTRTLIFRPTPVITLQIAEHCSLLLWLLIPAHSVCVVMCIVSHVQIVFRSFTIFSPTIAGFAFRIVDEI